MEEQVLIHHGIKGQKWGIRRFQNADGSLTSAGRKRYGTGEMKVVSGNTSKKRESLSDSQKQMLKNVGKAALIAGSVAAAGYLYSQHADEINDLIKEVGFQTYQNVRVQAKVGHNYMKNLSKQAHDGAKAGIAEAPKKVGEGVKEGISEGTKAISKALVQAPMTVGKVAIEGATIIMTKKMMDATFGKDQVDATTKAYNAYHKKNKVGQLNQKKDDEDDE